MELNSIEFHLNGVQMDSIPVRVESTVQVRIHAHVTSSTCCTMPGPNRLLHYCACLEVWQALR